tara:strand:- start:216 stop:398 length:183 start_codon:yes stop_codon:yes gene_type:complete
MTGYCIDVGRITSNRIKTMTKRNPYWKWLRTLKHKIVLAKKGKGSYNRKAKHQKGERQWT